MSSSTKQDRAGLDAESMQRERRRRRCPTDGDVGAVVIAMVPCVISSSARPATCFGPRPLTSLIKIVTAAGLFLSLVAILMEITPVSAAASVSSEGTNGDGPMLVPSEEEVRDDRDNGGGDNDEKGFSGGGRSSPDDDVFAITNNGTTLMTTTASSSSSVPSTTHDVVVPDDDDVVPAGTDNPVENGSSNSQSAVGRDGQGDMLAASSPSSSTPQPGDAAAADAGATFISNPEDGEDAESAKDPPDEEAKSDAAVTERNAQESPAPEVDSDDDDNTGQSTPNLDPPDAPLDDAPLARIPQPPSHQDGHRQNHDTVDDEPPQTERDSTTGTTAIGDGEDGLVSDHVRRDNDEPPPAFPALLPVQPVPQTEGKSEDDGRRTVAGNDGDGFCKRSDDPQQHLPPGCSARDSSSDAAQQHQGALGDEVSEEDVAVGHDKEAETFLDHFNADTDDDVIDLDSQSDSIIQFASEAADEDGSDKPHPTVSLPVQDEKGNPEWESDTIEGDDDGAFVGSSEPEVRPSLSAEDKVGSSDDGGGTQEVPVESEKEGPAPRADVRDILDHQPWGCYRAKRRIPDLDLLYMVFQGWVHEDELLQDGMQEHSWQSDPRHNSPLGPNEPAKPTSDLDAPTIPADPSRAPTAAQTPPPATAFTASTSDSSPPNVNFVFVEGLNDIDKFFEGVEPPDELDVGASGSSIQEVLVGKGREILIKKAHQAIEIIQSCWKYLMKTEAMATLKSAFTPKR